jgi:hypothetical protein
MKKVVIILISIVTLCIALYFIMVQKYTKVYPPNFYINDRKVTNLTPQEVIADFENETAHRAITINGITKSFKECGLYDSMDNQIEEYNPYYWFNYFLIPQHIVRIPHLELDHNSFNSFIENVYNQLNTNVVSEDAYIDFVDGKYVVIAEKYGTQIDKHKFKLSVLDNLQQSCYNMDITDCYILPQITTGNLIDKVEKINHQLDTTINLQFSEEYIITIPQEIILRTYTLDGIDFTSIQEYIETLKQYNTKGTTRTFKTSYNTEIKVKPFDNTIFGWEIDIDALSEKIYKHIHNAESGVIEVPFISKGFSFGKSDIGNSYIEISIDNQRMWLYKNGKCIVDTPIVTGNVSANMNTPKGLFQILQMSKDYTMKGSYGTSDCSYFMRLTWTGIAIHDATWRYYFGGNIYKTNGSHGCINTPFANAEKIFNNIYKGLPVIVY